MAGSGYAATDKAAVSVRAKQVDHRCCVPVRNVAQPVIRRAFAVYSLEPQTRLARSASDP